MQFSLDLNQSTSASKGIYTNELALSYKKSVKLDNPDFLQINSSLKVSQILRTIWEVDQINIRESFYLLCFSNKLDLLGYYKVAEGGLDQVLVDIRIVFSTALLARSSSIVVAHNHPSGTCEPSSADRTLTRRLAEAGELLAIRLNDHIILTEDNYYSFRDEGYL